MSRKLQVGDWVRYANGASVAKVETEGGAVYWQGDVDEGFAVRVIVRDVPQPRKVKASELWAWLRSMCNDRFALTYDQRGGCWEVWNGHRGVSVATGPTPLRAIINARKALKVKP